MMCSQCSSSSESSANFCSCCGRPLVGYAPYPAGPLTRARTGRMIAGVCAGFANAYRLDVTLTRLVVCALAFFSAGTVVVAYVIAWILMPQEPSLGSTIMPGGVVAS